MNPPKRSQPPPERTILKNVALFKEEVVAKKSSVTIIPLSEIILRSSQPRRYFDPKKLESLTKSIKKYGILEPLLVRRLPNGLYELVAGERRYISGKAAELTEAPVVILDLSEREAFQLSLVENLQREDLNPIEETEGILELLGMELKKERSEVVSLLYKMQNLAAGKITDNVISNSALDNKQSTDNVISNSDSAQKTTTDNIISNSDRISAESTDNIINDHDSICGLALGASARDNKESTDNVISNEQTEVVNTIFAEVGRMTWESFIVNRLPLLKLPEDVKEVLMTGKIEYTKAQAIARITDEMARKNLLTTAIEQSLSLAQIRELIKTNRPVKQKEDNIVTRMESTYKRVKKARKLLLENPKKKKKLESLLAQIDKLIAEDN